MNKFFRYFFPFLDEIFNSMIPLFQIDPLGMAITGGFSLLGGWMGEKQGAPATTTQRIEQVRPTLTPEEQAMQDFFRSQVYGKLGQVSPLQQLIEGYYAGGMPGTQQMPMGQMPTGTQAQITQAQYERPRQWEALQSTLNALKSMEDIAKRKGITLEDIPMSGGLFQGIASRMGISIENAKTLYGDWIKDPETAKTKYTSLEMPADYTIPKYWTEEQATEFWKTGKSPAPVTQPEQPTPAPLMQPGQPTERFGGPQPVTTQLTAEERLGQLGYQPAQPYSPLGAIMQQTPEQLAAQYDILRQQGMRGIEDWYQQAQREFEQRGIGQYGGYMGTPVERDIGGILGQRGRMETGLGAQLGLSQLQAQQQLPYGQLQALEDVRRWEAQNLLAQQAPWIGVGQQMYALPWGQTTTMTQQQPGPGIIPGAISGAYTGAGLYGMGQNLGWWGGGGSQIPTSTYMGGPTGFGTTGTSWMPVV